MIAPQFHPLVGGCEIAAERLSQALIDAGHEIQVVTGRHDNQWQRKEVIGRLPIHRIRHWNFSPLIRRISTCVSLLGYLLVHGRKFDLWHVHQYGDWAFVAILISKLLRRPVVLKLTSTKEFGITSQLDSNRLSRFLRMAEVHRTVDAVAAVSHETRQEAIEFGIPVERIFILGNGIDRQRFRPLSKNERNEIKERSQFGGRKLAIYVGRLNVAKHLTGLIEAWSEAIKVLDESWDLVLIGEGSMRQPIMELIDSLGITSRVHLLGNQSNVEQWLGIADLFMLSSFYEGMSNSLLEAMSCGLPVVATRVSGVSEIVDATQSGISVEIGDMKAFAQAIIRLAENQAMREAAGHRSAETIEEHYALPKVAQRYEQLYLNLTGKILNLSSAERTVKI